MATNGKQRILEIEPDSIHMCTPIYIGSKMNIEKLLTFLIPNKVVQLS